MSRHNLRVEKIGGTSMSRFSEIVENIILKNKEDIFNRVYIVSAYGGVTDELLEHKKSKTPGIYKKFEEQGDYRSAMETLKIKLCRINDGFKNIGLNTMSADLFIQSRINGATGILNAMSDVLSSGYVSRDQILPAARELLASLGEAHSAYNSADILRNMGYPTAFVDLSGWGDGRDLTIDERIADAFKTVNPKTTICFATGYVKGREGIMREFDRGYSEVTFSKTAVALMASEAIIHKEFHLCTGDPNIIGKAEVRPVCHTNFDVADQLADVGMEAIHPRAAKPLEVSGIPIRVKNAFDPDHLGTLITREYICPDYRTEIVTGSNKVTCVSVHDTRMVGEVGFDLDIMRILADRNISYIGKTTNANTIDIVVNDCDATDELVDTLRKKFESVTPAKVALVCAIGSNNKKPGIMAKAAEALSNANINILSVSHTTRQTNMQFVILREHFFEAQRVLHRSLCN